MASFRTWLDLLSYAKALYEAITFGLDLRQQYERHRNEADTIAEAQRASQVFSTYSEEEVHALLARMKACQERFMQEGDGPARKRCYCQVFRDAIDGNGGTLPPIDDWENIYQQMNCPK